jgi:anti-sigma B factor antagonist
MTQRTLCDLSRTVERRHPGRAKRKLAPMSQDELSIDIKREDGPDLLLFKLRGSLDLATSPTVRAALMDATKKGKRDLIVDLTQLEFLDSTGLGALIGAHRRMSEHGGSLRLIIAEGAISRLLNITGLVRVFSVYHSVEDARKNRARVAATI